MADSIDNIINSFQAPSGNQAQSDPIQGIIDSFQTKQSTLPPISGVDTESLVKKYFPPQEWGNALAVMRGESGGNSQAIGDNFPIKGETIPSYGLFQIRGLPGRPSPQQLLDPEFNVRYAAQMQAQQGWGPWTAARKLGIVGGIN